MSFDITLLLAFVQSATEFLPVSSSGHLVLMEKFGISNQSLLMDISLHLGTLFAVVIFFGRDIQNLAINFWRKGAEQRLVFQLIIASIPAGVAGFLGADLIETVLRSPFVIAFTSIFYGVLLWIADYFASQNKTIREMTYRDAFLIGCAQALALVPGTSRSGITMTIARFLGVNRINSAKFSMLMSIPIIGLGALYMFFRGLENSALSIQTIEQLVIGIGFSALLGLLTVWFLMRWLRTASFAIFAVYRIILGIFLLFFFW